LGERLNGIQEVGGSIPPGSTKPTDGQSATPRPRVLRGFVVPRLILH
jgi:hypothetical protein